LFFDIPKNYNHSIIEKEDRMSLEKVRVIAMGGCGGMGRFAVQTALTFDFVDQIVVAGCACMTRDGYSHLLDRQKKDA
jgi:hypothetical protein